MRKSVDDVDQFGFRLSVLSFGSTSLSSGFTTPDAPSTSVMKSLLASGAMLAPDGFTVTSRTSDFDARPSDIVTSTCCRPGDTP